MYRGMDIDAIKGHLGVCLLITEDEQEKDSCKFALNITDHVEKKKSYER